MVRFRRSGVAWDGQRWVLAPALVVFADQIEEIRPEVGPADGTVASEGHDQRNPNSDHTVWPKSGSGIVYAIDVHETRDDLIDEIWESIRKSRDPRVKYAIHHGRLFSSYPAHGYDPYTWRPYTGGGHIGHGHLSILHDRQHRNDRSSWDVGSGSGGHIPVEEFIKDEQKNLNAAGFKGKDGKPLKVDGILGPNTKFARAARDEAAAQKVSGVDATARRQAAEAQAKAANAHARLDRLHNV